MKTNIPGISEVRWQGARKITFGTFGIFYSEGTEHERGVAILLDQNMVKTVKGLATIRQSFTFKVCRKTIGP